MNIPALGYGASKKALKRKLRASVLSFLLEAKREEPAASSKKSKTKVGASRGLLQVFGV